MYRTLCVLTLYVTFVLTRMPKSIHYSFAIFNTGTMCMSKYIHIFQQIHSKKLLKQNYIDKIFFFSEACCISVIHNWNKTLIHYSKANLIFQGNISVCLVLRTAQLQRKTLLTLLAMLYSMWSSRAGTLSLTFYEGGCSERMLRQVMLSLLFFFGSYTIMNS